MWGNDRFRHFEETLVEIKAAVTPLARMSTELEAQTKNLGEGLERAFMEVKAVSQKLDKVSGEFAERVEDSEKGFTEKVNGLGGRVNELEKLHEQGKGAWKVASILWAAFGAAILGALWQGGMWVYAQIDTNEKRITKIEMTVEQIRTQDKSRR